MTELTVTIPAIIVICYLIGMACKATEHVKDNYIPVIMGAVGGLLGVVGMLTITDFPASDILNSVAIGITSGLAATGANQVVKQLSNK